ncbi:uncharacterized protein L203_102308 [Cryptococcus depauperatus CBS 7841]|uniref:Uncharacterized protein n=1 Tax=Cryptococcus depauperatus CBS 7841 TaxID=1295531 RepID=A0AAJ8JRP2_9TREE
MDAKFQVLTSQLARRPDILLAIAKRHSTDTLFHPVPSSLSKPPAATPRLRLSVPQESPPYDTLGITLETKAKSINVDITLEGKARTARELKQIVEKMGNDAMAYYHIILRSLVTRYLGRWMIPGAAWFAAACHLVIEPLVLLKRLIRHRVPIVPSTLYMLTVVLIGFGGFLALNHAVIQERIRLILLSDDSRKTQ